MPTSNGHKDKPGIRRSDNPADESSAVAKAVEGTKRLGAYLEDKADQATKSIGAGMESVGEAIHKRGPHTGPLHDIREAMAGRLESGGRYLESHGLSGICEDTTNLIRRNPVPALLIGAGIGFMLARLMKRS